MTNIYIHIFYNIMINLLPQRTKCGSYVTDSIESEIEQHEKLKTGNYINGDGYAMIV